MTHPIDRIIYIDNHLIAVTKPAGLLTQPDRNTDESLIDQTRQWIKEKYNKPNNIFLGLVHRLDRNVSGVVLFARTSKAASRLSIQFREGTPKKHYRAIVLGKLKEEQTTLVHYLRKEKSLRATVFPRETPTAKRSELSYEVIYSLEKNLYLKYLFLQGDFTKLEHRWDSSGTPS